MIKKGTYIAITYTIYNCTLYNTLCTQWRNILHSLK